MEQMTAEQAINYIKKKYVIDEETQDSKALKMAVDALEKQVPKEYIKRYYPDEFQSGFGHCPTCKAIFRRCPDETRKKYGTWYCWNCGQTLVY